MVEVIDLWLPILLTAVALFFLGFLSWMVLQLHRQDWIGLPDEGAFAKVLGELNIPAGSYCFPNADSMEEMKSEEFLARQQNGPNGFLTVFPGPCNMGKTLGCQFVFLLVTTFCLAYLATLGVPAGAEFMQVFRFVTTAAFLTYTTANVPAKIWFNVRFTGYLIDGVLHALATGLIFAAFWPNPVV